MKKDDLTVAVDMSLRSTGLVILDKNNNLVNFKVIKTSAQDFTVDEDLIDYVKNEIDMAIDEYKDGIKRFVIEGLSFNGFSARKDVIAGLYWAIRVMVYFNHPSVLLGSVPVTTWRKRVMSGKEFKEIKKECKNYLKDGVFSKLPDGIAKRFLLYIEENGLPFDSVYDLSDAYFLGVYRNSMP